MGICKLMQKRIYSALLSVTTTIDAAGAAILLAGSEKECDRLSLLSYDMEDLTGGMN